MVESGLDKAGISARAALAQVLNAVDWQHMPVNHVKITGEDPVLPTNFMVGTAGAAAIAATGLAAADLWELRTGRRQDVAIDVRTAAMALRSERYIRLTGQSPKPSRAAISGFYETGEGRTIQIHCNFPHHRDGVLKLLGCAEDRDAVAAAIKGWKAAKLEDTLAEAGMCATMTRTHAEWAAHPHAPMVDRLPLLEVIKIADSPPEPLPEGDRPLAGIRALDLTRVLAGPTCGRTLAEHGADVMRIAGPHLPFHEKLVMDTGHGKLAAHIDLREESGVARLRHLVSEADIFSQSYRPGTLAGRGFSPEMLAELRPGIVYVTLSAFGREGPWSNRRGFDTLVQGATGIADEQGGGQPRHLPGSVLDYATGFLMAFGAMVALARRTREGGSYTVYVSLCQTAHWLKRLGRVAGNGDARQLPDPSFEDVADLTIESDTPFGRLVHLAPAVQLSETPPRWSKPVVPLGTHEPIWPN